MTGPTAITETCEAHPSIVLQQLLDYRADWHARMGDVEPIDLAIATIRHLSERVRVKDEEIARLRGDASRFSATFQRFPDGSLKPFLSPDRYDDLRNDDRFLYNRGPKPEGLK